ncbi:squalene/phytoene synthase family protein [Flavobacterium sp. NST-5]|uniref:Squalene/phytoene synthase family protein n=1 Tax=Flavobacterium ichthyis TaxID=2698827 RepID=A0ABW9ZBD9_9FLAO|nr:phytoene/squalene synthase family protein [Flavobacterium ichthyis]NBL66039.1 squalene/phytoene synthase family protein [Flavobacterium ichthyis]
MKAIFDSVSNHCCTSVTRAYSTSFSTAVKILSPSIRQDIYNIYGFVRLADEIVDSFHDYPKEILFDDFEKDLYNALKNGISLNPILNAFQSTVRKHNISQNLIESFMKSMRMDLSKTEYKTTQEYLDYIYGSADVVGLMCLQVFVGGDEKEYGKLKNSAMKLGSAFQKINFLRDLKADFEGLSRTYFPETNLHELDENAKKKIVDEIELDLQQGYEGILQLPIEAKFGVYTAYIYYKTLLSKLKKTPSAEIKNARIRVSDYQKVGLFAQCYFRYKLNMI